MFREFTGWNAGGVLGSRQVGARFPARIVDVLNSLLRKQVCIRSRFICIEWGYRLPSVFCAIETWSYGKK